MEQDYQFVESASELQGIFTKILNFLKGGALTGLSKFSFGGDVECTVDGTKHTLSSKMNASTDIVTRSDLKAFSDKVNELNTVVTSLSSSVSEFEDYFEEYDIEIKSLKDRIKAIEDARYPKYLGWARYVKSTSEVKYVGFYVIEDDNGIEVKKYTGMSVIEDTTWAVTGENAGSFFTIPSQQRLVIWNGSAWEFSSPEVTTLKTTLTETSLKATQLQQLLNNGTWSKNGVIQKTDAAGTQKPQDSEQTQT